MKWRKVVRERIWDIQNLYFRIGFRLYYYRVLTKGFFIFAWRLRSLWLYPIFLIVLWVMLAVFFTIG